MAFQCQGAQTLGYSDLSHGIFPKGGVELVYHFEEKSTKQLAALLQQDKDQTKASPSQYVHATDWLVFIKTVVKR